MGNSLVMLLHMLNNLVMRKVSYFYTTNLTLNFSVNQGVRTVSDAVPRGELQLLGGSKIPADSFKSKKKKKIVFNFFVFEIIHFPEVQKNNFEYMNKGI